MFYLFLFIKYIFVPVFVFLIIYKGLNYSENWQYRGFKEFLITCAKDALLTIIFLLFYCTLPKTMNKRMVNAYLRELNKLESLSIKVGPKDNEDKSYYHMSWSGSADELGCPVLRYSGPGYDKLFETDVSEDPEQSLSLLVKRSHQKMQAKDHGADSKALIKVFFSALQFDLMHWDIFESFDFSLNLDIPIDIRDEFIYVNLYPCNRLDLSPKFAIAKVFLLNAFFGMAPYTWSVSRNGGVGGQVKSFQEFRSRHNLHPDEVINSWLRNLPETAENQWIFDDWEKTRESGQRYSEDYSGTFNQISFSLNDWADKLLYWYKKDN